MADSDPLEKQFDYYLEHQDELVEKYDGKVLVIKDFQVIGAYDDELEAAQETVKTEELGTFIVQRCTPGDSAYTMTLFSQAAFA